MRQLFMGKLIYHNINFKFFKIQNEVFPYKNLR